MPDYGFNTQLTPNIPQTNISDMINLARGVQGYQQSQQMNPLELQIRQQQLRQAQTIDPLTVQAKQMEIEQAQKLNPLAVQTQTQEVEKGGIELAQRRQANTERLAIQNAIKENPDLLKTDGRFDLSKANNILPKLAPITHPEYITKFTSLNNSQTLADEAGTKLAQDRKSIIGAAVSSLGYGGTSDPSVYISALDRLKKFHPNDTAFGQMADAYSDMFKQLPAGTSVSEAAIKVGQGMLPQTTQAEAFRPTADTINVGGQILKVTKTPSVGGAAPSMSIVGEIPTTLSPGVYTINGVSYTYQNGKFAPAGGTTAPMAAPAAALPAAPPAAPAAAPAAARLVREDMPVATGGIAQLNSQQQVRFQEGQGIQKNSTDAVQAAGEMGQSIRKIRETINSAAGSAPGKALRQAGQWIAGAPELETLTKNLADLYVRNATAMGANTDQARSSIEAITGSPNITAEALNSIVDRADASAQAMKKFNNGLNNYMDKSGPYNGSIHARNFQQAWNANYDPLIFMAQSINSSNKSPAEKEIMRQKMLMSLSDDQRKELAVKAANIKKLEAGDK
jgi:hypothetical protein